MQLIRAVLLGQSGFDFGVKIIRRFDRRNGIMAAHPAVQIDISAALGAKRAKGFFNLSLFAYRAFRH